VVKASEAVYAGYENDVISSLALVKKGGGVGGAVKDANAWLQVPNVAMTNHDVIGLNACLPVCILFIDFLALHYSVAPFRLKHSPVRRCTKYRTCNNLGFIPL
jgi:hypothetical protein